MRMSSGALLALVMLGATIGPTSAQDVHTLKIGCVLDPPATAMSRFEKIRR